MGGSVRAGPAPQWQCGPVPQQPQEPELRPQAGASSDPPAAEANTDSFFESRTEPQCGHLVPFQSAERTSSSLSRSQAAQ